MAILALIIACVALVVAIASMFQRLQHWHDHHFGGSWSRHPSQHRDGVPKILLVMTLATGMILAYGFGKGARADVEPWPVSPCEAAANPERSPLQHVRWWNHHGWRYIPADGLWYPSNVEPGTGGCEPPGFVR